MASTVPEVMENNERRPSVVSDWGSFGGFQWEGPSIFDEEGKPVVTSQTQLAPDMPGGSDPLYTPYDSSILSVPMLPGVSLEPIYRQQRSLSFSMGQDPTFFGYDDYDDASSYTAAPQQSFKTSLAPMAEEEDGYLDDFDMHIRSRSKSSGAAFGLLSQAQHTRLMNSGHMRRGSEQDDLIGQRRHSRFFNIEHNMNQMSLGDKERLLQRRASQSQEYAFPDNRINQRRPSNNVQQITEQLENTHFGMQPPPMFIQPNYPPPPPPPSYYQRSTQAQAVDEYFDADPRGFQDLGKGVPLHRLDPNVPLYMVEFKGGRTDFFYVLDSHQFSPRVGDLVIVEGDRGKDLGKVTANTLTTKQVTLLEHKKQALLQQLEPKHPEPKEQQQQQQQQEDKQKEIHVKRIFRLAAPDEINMLLIKGQDEHKALVVCQQKTKQRKLPMEVVDAEYQW
jgi:hypothetical protein